MDTQSHVVVDSGSTGIFSTTVASPSGAALSCVHIVAASGGNATQVKASAGVVSGLDVFVTGTGCQVRLYNTASAAAITGTATNLVATYLVPSGAAGIGGTFSKMFDPPLGGFTNGIAICFAAYGLNDSSSLGVLLSSTMADVYFA